MLNQLYKVYSTLKKEYCVEDWWPVYDGREPFTEISVGAILTQNTNWNNVEKALKHLISKDLITLESIKNADKKIIEELVKPAGFYKRKSETIKEFADRVYGRKNIDRELLLSIKGIGKETADSILLYALNKPVFVIDAYAKRLFSRLGYISEDISYDNLQSFFHKNLEKDVTLFQEYHAGIVEHCKSICKKKPLCENCPLKDFCKYKKQEISPTSQIHKQQEGF